MRKLVLCKIVTLAIVATVFVTLASPCHTAPIGSVSASVDTSSSTNYRRWAAIWNRADEPLTDYPLEITSQDGTGFDHAALVATNKSQTDGRDLRIEIDGLEIDRWLAGANTSNCKVWVNLDLQSPKTATLSLAFGSGDAIPSLQVNDTTGFPERGILYNLDSGEAFIYAGRDGTHFLDVIRAARNTAAAPGSIGDTIIWIEHDIWLTYGGNDAKSPDDDYKPIFRLDTSTNTTWDYAEFGEDDGLRTGDWVRQSVVGSPTFYDGNHNTNANPWAEIGLRTVVNYTGRVYLHNPCGITSAHFENGEKRREGIAQDFECRIQSSVDGTSWSDEYTIPAPASMNAWESWSREETLASTSKYVALYNEGQGNPVYMYLEAASCTLTLDSSNTPAIIMGEEQPWSSSYYRRWIAVWNRAGSTLDNYPLEITSQAGTGFDHAALVTVGKSKSDGSDLQVRVDGWQVSRWLDGVNTANCKVWIDLDLEPGHITKLSDAFASNDIIASLAVTDTTGFPSSGILYNLASGEAFTYTGKDSTHFTGITRAEKDTAAATGTVGDTIIWIEHDIWLLYSGDNSVSANNHYKPAFRLNTSTNTTWDYAEFGEDDGLRTASWSSQTYQSSTFSVWEFYGGNHGTDANPWEELGIQVEAIVGIRYLHNPCGITAANFQEGEKKADNLEYFAAAISSSSSQVSPPSYESWTYEYLLSSPTVADAWEPWSRNETLNLDTKQVGLSLIHPWVGVTSYIEAARVTITLDNSSTPAIIMNEESGVGISYIHIPLILYNYPLIHELGDAPDTCPGYGPLELFPPHLYYENFDHPYDEDWYTFDAIAGTDYSISSSGLESRADTVMFLFTPGCPAPGSVGSISCVLNECKLGEDTVANCLCNDDITVTDKESLISWSAPSTTTPNIFVRNYNWGTDYGVNTGYTLSITENP